MKLPLIIFTLPVWDIGRYVTEKMKSIGCAEWLLAKEGRRSLGEAMEKDEPPPVRIVIIETQSEAIVSAVLRELSMPERNQRVYVERVDHVGDVYDVSGQAGAVGSHAKSRDDTFIQVSGQDSNHVDLARMAIQLEMLRGVMKRESGATPTAEQDDEIGHVARAQIAAQKGDGEGVVTHLKRAGIWTLRVAREAGAEIVALTLAHLVKG